MSSPNDFVIVTNPIIKATPESIEFDCGPGSVVYLRRVHEGLGRIVKATLEQSGSVVYLRRVHEGLTIWQFTGKDVEVRRGYADAYRLRIQPDTEQPF